MKEETITGSKEELTAQLMMLYHIAEPLIFDCIRTKKETALLISEIQKQLYIINDILHPIITVKYKKVKEQDTEGLRIFFEEHFGKVLENEN
jgi:hypothetical protein